MLTRTFQLAEADLAQQALNAATQVTQTVGQTAQFATKNATETFSRFVEGDDASTHARGAVAPEKRDFWDSFGAAPTGPSKDKQDFWNSFGASAASAEGGRAAAKPASVGTSAMRKGPSSSGAGGAGGNGYEKLARKDKDGQEDEWGEW